MASGVMPKAAATSLGSMVLTKSIRRVLRIIRGPKPQPSRTWPRYAIEAGLGPALVPFGNHDMRITGAPRLAVSQTTLHNGPTGGVHGNRVRPVAEPDGLQARVDVVAAQ